MKMAKVGIPCSHILAFCYSLRLKKLAETDEFNWDWVLALIKPRWISKQRLFDRDIELASLQSSYKGFY